MSLRSAIASLVLLFVPLVAEEEIRVELATQKTLAPFYLGRMQGEHSDLSTTYLKTLHDILAFDLAHCGYASVSEREELLEKALAHREYNVAFNPQRWSKGGTEFVLRGIVSGRKLDIDAFNVRQNVLKQFEGIQLTGNLKQDRTKIHKLSDALLKTLLGVEGVADTVILFSTQIDNLHPSKEAWKAEIWQCDWDGGNARQVTDEKNYAITPTFIPRHEKKGGDRYLYVNYSNGQPKIYLSSLKQKTGKPLLSLRGNQLLPSVSKQRDQLAFICDASGRADLFVQKIDEDGTLAGKPSQLFSYPRSTQASPTFSPDGSKIAFVSDKDGTPRVYITPSHTDNNKRPKPALITKENRENTCPNWSPDGKKIAYSAKTKGVRQIWIYDFETEEERQLTTGPGNKENPCWAPNSLHLVFNSTDPGSSELYLVNLNQPEAVKITGGTGKKHYPTWGTR